MAAPAAHHTQQSQESSTPFDLQQPLVLPQAHPVDRPSASSVSQPGGLGSASTFPSQEQPPSLPLLPRKLTRTRTHSSRHVPVASNRIGGLDTGGLVVLGEPVTMEELRWERAKFIKRRTRRWRAAKEGLGLIVLSWTTYQTVRYFVAYTCERVLTSGRRSVADISPVLFVANHSSLRRRHYPNPFRFCIGASLLSRRDPTYHIQGF